MAKFARLVFFADKFKFHVRTEQSFNQRPTFDMIESEISDFFHDQTVLLTGATGFLGKQILYKLLSSLKIRKIYVLAREKKGQRPEERLDLLLDGFCFDALRRKNPRFVEKVSVFGGDCTLPDLGMTLRDREVLMQEVNTIVHVSATVRFDEKIRLAAYVNVRAVRDLLRLARNVKDLKAFIFVSTAYSNCTQKFEIGERFYPPPMSARKLFKVLEGLDEEFLDEIKDRLLKQWPNTYTFTKAVAEDTIKEEGRGLPIAIVRPSIIMGPVGEPEPGWFDTLQGITGLSLAVYLGLLRCLFIDRAKNTAIVPSDYAANVILAAAWDLQEERGDEVPIYNYADSKRNLLTWGEILGFLFGGG